ncbi:MAG: asparaginase [Chthonomonadales bacterium]
MPDLSSNPQSPLVVSFMRGDFRETTHHLSMVMADESGAVHAFHGDQSFVTGFRSAAKPLQAIPIITLPGFEELNLSGEEVAICCASHPGTPEHAAFAAAALSVTGFNPDDLICGPMGNPPACLKHGCSGNHAALLIGAKLLGAPLVGYHLPDHPIQIYIADLIKKLSGASEIKIATDGCGVPTFAIQLREMATSFAALSGSNGKYERITNSMRAHPHLVGQDRGIDVGMMKSTRGRLFAKTGAEGLLCIGYPDRAQGIAIKCHDGSWPAIAVAGLRFLIELGWMSQVEAEDPVLSKWWKEVDGPVVPASYCRMEVSN